MLEPVSRQDWDDELLRLCERRPELSRHVDTLRGATLGPRQTLTWLTEPATLLSGEVPADLVATNPGRVATAVRRLAARIASNAAIDQRIQAEVASANFGADLAARGETVVALEDEGRMVEYRPDGTIKVLD